jgi:hypothetical protein
MRQSYVRLNLLTFSRPTPEKMQQLTYSNRQCYVILNLLTFRPTPEQMQQLTYFEDVGVKTLQLLDSQFQWDNLQKSQFYKVAILFCKTVFFM